MCAEVGEEGAEEVRRVCLRGSDAWSVGGGLRGWGTGSWTWTGDENNVDKKRTWMRKMAAGILPFAAKLKEGTRGRSTDAAISAALAAQANQQRRRLDDKAYAKMHVDE